MFKKGFKGRGSHPEDFVLLRDQEIMEVFGISRSLLYQWKKNGFIPYLTIGSISYYIWEDVLKMLRNLGGNTVGDAVSDHPEDTG